MAVTTFAVTDSNVFRMGVWTYGANTGGQPAYYISGASVGASADFNAIGTDARLQIYTYNVADSYQIIIDGTPAAPLAAGFSGWGWITLFTGLSDTEHTVSVYRITTGNSYVIHSTSGIEVTGASPSLASPAGYAPLLIIKSAPFSTYGRLDGHTSISTISGQTSMPGWAMGDGGIRFEAAVTGIKVWINTGTGTDKSIGLWEDDVEVASISPIVSDTLWKLLTFAVTLDGTNHTYRIVNSSMANPMFIGGVMLYGGTGLTATTVPAKDLIGWYGDSIIAGNSGGITSAYDGVGWKTAENAGMVSVRRGFSGKTVTTYLRDNTAMLTIPVPPKYIILEGGVNDQATSVTIGDVSTAGTFAGDMLTMLSNMAGKVATGGVMYVQGILPNISTNYANRATYVNAQIAAVDAYMSTTPAIPAYFINTDGWINTSTDLEDTVHPNADGYTKIADQWMAILLPDSTAPEVTAFVIPSTSDSLTVAITEFTATDDSGTVAGYLVTESDTTPDVDHAGWSATAQTEYVFSTEGSKTLYAWAKDAVGNISTSLSDSVVVTLPDITAPEITTFTLPATADSITLDVTLTATDAVGVTGYYLSESGTTPAVDAEGWTETPPATFELSPTQTRTVYAWAKDAAGNISEPVAASVDVTLTGAAAGDPMYVYHDGNWILVGTLITYPPA